MKESRIRFYILKNIFVNFPEYLKNKLETFSFKFRTRHLRCEKSSCEEFIVLHLGYLDYTRYILKIYFYGLEGFNQRYIIRDITFYVSIIKID